MHLPPSAPTILELLHTLVTQHLGCYLGVRWGILGIPLES